MLASALYLAATPLQHGSPPGWIGAAAPSKQIESPCSFEGGSTLVKRKSDLPPKALLEVERLFRPINGIAEVGELFESTDAPATNAPRARFIRAYHVQSIWFIWFERGSIGKYTVALVPTIDEETGLQALRVAGGSSFHGDLCAGSKAFIAGARGGG